MSVSGDIVSGTAVSSVADGSRTRGARPPLGIGSSRSAHARSWLTSRNMMNGLIGPRTGEWLLRPDDVSFGTFNLRQADSARQSQHTLAGHST
jgi:hypothetical protein